MMLKFTCSTTQQEFESGLYASKQGFADLEEITVRVKCPLCGALHTCTKDGGINQAPEPEYLVSDW